MQPKPRTHLYVPADQPRFVRSAANTSADAVIFDLEDGVAPGRKATALKAVQDAVGALPEGVDRWVRVNAGAAGRHEIESILRSVQVDGFWLPKATRTEDIRSIADLVADRDPPVSLGLVIESAVALVELRSLAAVPGVRALQLGEIDLRADLGMPDGPEEDLIWARAQMLTHSTAARLDFAVGPVYPLIDDIDGFTRSCRLLERLGYPGRACLHPRQVEIANEVFGVDADTADAAATLLERFETAVASGQGVFRDDHGRMIDAASVRRARTLAGRRTTPVNRTAERESRA